MMTVIPSVSHFLSYLCDTLKIQIYFFSSGYFLYPHKNRKIFSHDLSVGRDYVHCPLIYEEMRSLSSYHNY